MTATNPHPLANPYNDRPIGNLSFGKMTTGGYFRRDSKATLPDSTFTYTDYQEHLSQLHVPDSDSQIHAQFQGKFVNGILDLRGYSKDWTKDELLAFPSNFSLVGMTRSELERDNMLKLKSAEMYANMTDELRNLLADIDSYLGKSRFEVEN